MARQTDMSPSDYPFSITPNDSTVLGSHRAISVAVGGAIKITRLDDTTDTITVPAGVIAMVIKVLWSTGTTATGFAGYR